MPISGHYIRMAKNYLEAPPNAVRRKDREVADDAWIHDLLHRTPMGVLATVHDGQPFVNSNTFAYDEAEHAIYMHTHRTGRTASNVGGDERVCFTVTEMGRLLPAPRAFNMSVEYEGVVVFGAARLVLDEAEKARCLQQVVDKYFGHLRPGDDYAPPSVEELALTSVYRIAIE